MDFPILRNARATTTKPRVMAAGAAAIANGIAFGRLSQVLGRYVVKCGMPPEWSAGFAAGSRWYCWRQSALWKVKRVVKVLGGGRYVKVRKAIIERKG